MDVSHDLQQSNTHFKPISYIHFVARVVTGFLLGVKGFYFIYHSVDLRGLIMKTSFGGHVSFFVSYITFAHLLGGAFIMMGLLTRVAIALQIPIIIAAIFYNLSPNPLGTTSEVILSIALLIMLVYVLIKGGGKLSMDYYLKKHLL